MEKIFFKNLLLKTALSCMASDGHIDEQEIQIINKLCEESHYFDNNNFQNELTIQSDKLNNEGKKFVNDYLHELKSTVLDEKEELTIIDFAIKTIEADEEIHYSEIKFFKIIKSKLKISKDIILAHFPGIEDFLEDDIITDNHLSELLEDSFQKLGNLNISFE